MWIFCSCRLLLACVEMDVLLHPLAMKWGGGSAKLQAAEISWGSVERHRGKAQSFDKLLTADTKLRTVERAAFFTYVVEMCGRKLRAWSGETQQAERKSSCTWNCPRKFSVCWHLTHIGIIPKKFQCANSSCTVNCPKKKKTFALHAPFSPASQVACKGARNLGSDTNVMKVKAADLKKCQIWKKGERLGEKK